jgi:hypothetical protein
MTEQTTTDEPILPDGAEEALPSEDQEDSAALAAKEPENSQTQGDEETSVPEVDDDKLKAWAGSKGIDLDSPSAIKAAKIAMDSQAEFQRKAQKASELEKSIVGSSEKVTGQPAAADDIGRLQSTVNNLLIKDQVNTFFSRDDVDKSMRPKMAGMVKSDPNLGALVEQGYLSLERLYDMARGADSERVRAEGAQKALQQLANKQTAKAVPGGATTSSFSVSGKKDAFEAGFDSA